MKPVRRSFLLLLACLASASCGGSSTGSTSTSGDEDDEMCEMVDDPQHEHRGNAIETIGISGPSTPWAQMNRTDREMYMVGKVLPIMNQLFEEQFPTRYAEGHRFTCETCHGSDPAAHDWAMPSGSLMPLPAQNTPAAEALAASMPESLRFMRETVTPTMGTLIGAENYRCSGCHTSMP